MTSASAHTREAKLLAIDALALGLPSHAPSPKFCKASRRASRSAVTRSSCSRQVALQHRCVATAAVLKGSSLPAECTMLLSHVVAPGSLLGS
eukprot:scaffold13706_cov121-Isochrysis_galbana.AAC.9